MIKPKKVRVKDPIRNPNITMVNELSWKIEWKKSFNKTKEGINSILKKSIK